MNKLSIRPVAKELAINSAYPSDMPNGKRHWLKDLYQRYMEFGNRQIKRPPQSAFSLGVKKFGAGRGTRTHTPAKVADFKSAASTIPPSRL